MGRYADRDANGEVNRVRCSFHRAAERVPDTRQAAYFESGLLCDGLLLKSHSASHRGTTYSALLPTGVAGGSALAPRTDRVCAGLPYGQRGRQALFS